jgi:hypothetical protein
MTSTHNVAERAAPVSRPLGLTTPLSHGPDVEALQKGLRRLLDSHKIDWLPLRVDGKMGPQTLHAARFLTWVIGLGKGHREPIQKRDVVTQATQHLLRNPPERSDLERRREKERRRRLKKIRARQESGTAGAIAYARACIGMTESPAGSNKGPDTTVVVDGRRVPAGVSMWQRKFGLDGAFWCLCFASYAAIEHGGAKISGNVTYSVAIESYARLHTNGWIQVAYEDRRPGDFTIWKFDGPNELSDHGEMLVEMVEDVGGNTSSEGGSQSNGGGVFAKQLGSPTRPLSSLSMVVRPLYKP